MGQEGGHSWVVGKTQDFTMNFTKDFTKDYTQGVKDFTQDLIPVRKHSVSINISLYLPVIYTQSMGLAVNTMRPSFECS